MFDSQIYRRNGSSGAWKRLGLSKPRTLKTPFLSPLSVAARKIGGKAEFMKLARLSTDKRIGALVSLWERLSKSDQRYVSLDNLCEACGIAPEKVFGAVIAAAHASGLDASGLFVAAFDHLKILENCIEGALKEAGSNDRKKLLAQIL
jgi:hypothetical protein